MRLHRKDRAVIGSNIRLEVIHESNPYFAGEPICLLIRLKHLGSQHQREIIKKKLAALENQRSSSNEGSNNNGDEKLWLVKTLWNTFHQEEKFKDEELQEQINELNRKLQFHEPVDLMSCFVQILGQCSIDDSVIDEKSLNIKQNRQKLVGIESKQASVEDQPSMINLISTFFNTNIDDLGEQISTAMSTEVIDTKDWIKVPFLLVPQTLLFPELTFEPGETKMFKFNTEPLPNNLPPSYLNSSHFNISYMAQIGITGSELNELPLQRFYNFPISVQPFIDQKMCQHELTLSKELIITKPGKVQDVDNLAGTTKSVGSSTQPNKLPWSLRRKSVSTGKKSTDSSIDSMKLKFKEVVSCWNENEDTDVPINSLINYQFDSESNSKSFSVREVLNQFYSGDLDLTHVEESKESDMYFQLQNIQKDFVIKMNEKFICNLELSKPVYSILDQIDLTLDFSNESVPANQKITAVTASIESFELVNPKFAFDKEISKKKPTGTTIYESHMINFDDSKKMYMKLMPQVSPNNHITSQFKTDLFQLKWMLSFKFVMVPSTDDNDNSILEKTYEDKKGKLLHAKQNLEGQDFIFHVPLTILPTEKQLAGW